jgi:4-hydroxy-3-methylbut-2-en-1-yl diphosphate reductase
MTAGVRPVVDVSPCAGFCGGVRRTLLLVDKLLKGRPGTPIYMLGKIVHNEHVLRQLKKKGLRIIDNFQEARDGILVIQSHGIPRSLFDTIRASGIEFVDSTCPMVKKIHEAARKLRNEGRKVIIIGKKDHDEVRGIAGQVDSAVILGSPSEAVRKNLRGIVKAGIVVQSTFILEDARRILKAVKKHIKDVKYVETICQPTLDRQDDAARNASRYNCVFVLGSRDSANTINLYNIVKNNNRHVHLITGPDDVNRTRFHLCDRYYVISGASTPQDLIEEIVMQIRRKLGKMSGRRH